MSETTITAGAADVARSGGTRARAWLRRHGLLAGITLLLAGWTVRRILLATGGEAAAPLDDTFIHFQYARSFAELAPFRYSPGADPAPGATSLLWPLLLSIPYALGLRTENLLWAAWLYSFVALGLLAYETSRAARKITSHSLALAAGGMVLCFGGFSWFAASGMEVVPLAWLLMRSARRAAEWGETRSSGGGPRTGELIALSWAAPAMRPEGALAALMIAVVLASFARGRARLLSLAALLGAFFPPFVNLLFTGQAASTTATVKWLPFSPYYHGEVLVAAIRSNVELLFGTLLDGRIWSSVFLPSGIAWLSAACVPALLVAGVRRGVWLRAVLITTIALGILIPTSYDSFLWNRLRYLWPFVPAWFVGAVALVDGLVELLSRFQPRVAPLRGVLAGALMGGLAGHLPFAFDDVAESADAIRRQQVSLGRWAASSLPADALIGVSDTGAIAYFSRKRVFDVVGLTTRGEARYWAAGAGSRLEHYERLGPARLPTHFIVYPEWFAIPAVRGEWLTERRVSATILGGETMVASRADWSALGSGEKPLDPELAAARLVDRLDVADLESEAAHAYELFWATQAENVAVEHEGRLDGARKNRRRESFTLALAPGGTLVARLGSEFPCGVSLSAGGKRLDAWQVDGDFQEHRVDLPETLAGGVQRVELTACESGVTALHYWSFAAR